ncbi:MAG: PDZ domain-containing protein [Sedimentisphaerales bacterium]|nr:PDZ domain-containing protein [Sedimentisphaerales bacterium]
MSRASHHRSIFVGVFLGCLVAWLSSCAQAPSGGGSAPRTEPRVAQREPTTTTSRPNPRLAQRERQAATATVDALSARRQRFRQGAGPEQVGGGRLGLAIADTPADAPVKGVLVQAVQAYSVAENAGLSAGDVLVELDGVAVTDAAGFRQTILGLAEDSSHTLTFVRDGSRMKSAVRLAAEATVHRAVAPARRGPLDINILKYALIDPQTRVVTFIGSYDPAYDTGPIPYADILEAVLANPYPSFSLEPSDQQRAEFAQVDRLISADIARMTSSPDYCVQWAQRLTDLLLYDTSLTVDNKRFFRNCGSALGMTGEELKRLFDAAKGRIEIPQAESFTLMAKLMRGVGLPDVADAMLAFAAGGTPDDILLGVCNAMHLRPQYDGLAHQLTSGSITYEKFKDEVVILAMSAICRRFEAPEAEIQRRASSVRSGAQPSDIMVDYFGEQLGSFVTNKAGARMLDGLVLSPELMSKLYNLPIPRVELVFTNVPAGSYLGDALYRADYLLKTLCSNPDIGDKVAGHLTDQAFLKREAVLRGTYLPAGAEVGVGNRLVPAEVVMRVSPRGDAVAFQNAQVKVISWVRELGGTAGNGPAAQFVRDVVPKYGQFLTERYDQYARAYPEWHRMSEVAKCVALARWARSHDYTLVVENASQEKIGLPRRIPGFWTAVFHAEGERAFLTVIEQGGASFAADEGEAWVQAQQDNSVTSDVSRQLVASAVLAEQAAMSAEAGDLETARELADKSARAMTGDIDLNVLPTLGDIPMPGEPATYAAADAELINQAAVCLDRMKTAQQDLQRADTLQNSSPQEAAALRQQATQAQDNAQAKLKELLSAASVLKAHPSYAAQVVVSLRSGTPMVIPTGASSGAQTANATSLAPPLTPKQEDWPTRIARLNAQLEEVERRIATTRTALLRLNATIQADRVQFEAWEQAAEDGFERCVGMAGDVAIDFAAGALSERYDTIYDLAKKLPNEPTDLIEKYRYLASLAQRMREAKATNDFGNLAGRENQTEAQMYETVRDGIGQIVGLLGLDKTVPGAAWKYGSLAADMAYNLTELYQGFKNVTVLESNQELQRQAVAKLAEQMRLLVEEKKKLRAEINVQ